MLDRTRQKVYQLQGALVILTFRNRCFLFQLWWSSELYLLSMLDQFLSLAETLLLTWYLETSWFYCIFSKNLTTKVPQLHWHSHDMFLTYELCFKWLYESKRSKRNYSLKKKHIHYETFIYVKKTNLINIVLW